MKYLGCGVGLRGPYLNEIMNGDTQCDWFEAITENLFELPGFGRGAFFQKVLKIRQKFPISLHGVSLNIGSADDLSLKYLNELEFLVKEIDPCWVSDHLCWTGVNGVNLHDLMPLPYTREALKHVAAKVQKVQDVIQRPLVLENVSSYFDYKISEMSEWEFLSELVKLSGCRLLLDVNNIFVSSYNHGFKAEDYLFGIPHDHIQQVHLAGHSDNGTHMVDTHDQPIREEVWTLYKKLIARMGRVNTLVERDDNYPTLKELELDVLKAKLICEPQSLGRGDFSEISL